MTTTDNTPVALTVDSVAALRDLEHSDPQWAAYLTELAEIAAHRRYWRDYRVEPENVTDIDVLSAVAAVKWDRKCSARRAEEERREEIAAQERREALALRMEWLIEQQKMRNTR